MLKKVFEISCGSHYNCQIYSTVIMHRYIQLDYRTQQKKRKKKEVTVILSIKLRYIISKHMFIIIP